MKIRLVLVILLLSFSASFARAHAFLDHAEPKVGSRIPASPGEVKIWFTEKLVGTFSELQVFDAAGKEVDKRDKKVDQTNPAQLVVSLPPLKPGKYKVTWKAVSVDTHTTRGDFTFEVAP